MIRMRRVQASAGHASGGRVPVPGAVLLGSLNEALDLSDIRGRACQLLHLLRLETARETVRFPWKWPSRRYVLLQISLEV